MKRLFCRLFWHRFDFIGYIRNGLYAERCRRCGEERAVEVLIS